MNDRDEQPSVDRTDPIRVALRWATEGAQIVTKQGSLSRLLDTWRLKHPKHYRTRTLSEEEALEWVATWVMGAEPGLLAALNDALAAAGLKPYGPDELANAGLARHPNLVARMAVRVTPSLAAHAAIDAMEAGEELWTRAKLTIHGFKSRDEGFVLFSNDCGLESSRVTTRSKMRKILVREFRGVARPFGMTRKGYGLLEQALRRLGFESLRLYGLSRTE